MSFIAKLAEQAAGGLVGAAMGIGSDAIATRRQVKAQKELTDYNAKTQLQMWKDTNYGPQVEQMKLAGINPGLIYGMSGGGATTTGGGAPGVSAQNSAAAGAGMGMQLQLLKAQKENIEADTAKKTMETDVIGGVNMQKTMQEASNVAQDTRNKEAQEQLTKAQTEIANIEADISRGTRQDKIDQIKANAIGEILRNELTKAQTGKTKSDINVNNAQITKGVADVEQGWEGLSNQAKQIAIQKLLADLQIDYAPIDRILTFANKILELKK